jgi:hypothetical protein
MCKSFHLCLQSEQNETEIKLTDKINVDYTLPNLM